VDNTGHPSVSLSNLPLNGRNTPEIHRSPGSNEGRESRRTGHANQQKWQHKAAIYQKTVI
jgi:hypothetical protein